MRILNFGSLNIDFAYAVDHIAVPGETIASKSLAVNPGGKGLNQSIALARAGAAVWHAGQVGTDGSFLVDLLKENGVDTTLLRTSADVRTGNAIIQTDAQGQNCIVLYGGANQMIDADYVDEVLADFQAGDWILLQNEISCLAYIVEAAHARGMRVILNPSPITDDLLKLDFSCVDMLILNEIEAAALTSAPTAGQPIDDAHGAVGPTANQSINDAHDIDDPITEGFIDNLRVRFADLTVVLTLGEKGSYYLGGSRLCSLSCPDIRDEDESRTAGSGDKECIYQPAYPVEAVDTTAAGDTFTGYLLASLAAGETPATAMRLAAAASALAVTRPGAAPSIPTRSEVDAFLRQAFV